VQFGRAIHDACTEADDVEIGLRAGQVGEVGSYRLNFAPILL
jgi:hypothetical protein